MDTTSKICDTIGRKVIAKSTGVKLTAVSNVCVMGIFPASWFDVVEKLCIEKGIACPRALFKFKAPPPAITTDNKDAA